MAARRSSTRDAQEDRRARGQARRKQMARRRLSRGLSAEERTKVSSAFAQQDLDVVVATNAFGMGIDRDDMRVVVHVQPPSSIEAYYQEVGRAGRDGDEAYGLLLCCGSDIALRRRLVRARRDAGASRAGVGSLSRAPPFLDARTCRHDFVLRYFGDESETLGGCGHCDVCEASSRRTRRTSASAKRRASSSARRSRASRARSGARAWPPSRACSAASTTRKRAASASRASRRSGSSRASAPSG